MSSLAAVAALIVAQTGSAAEALVAIDPVDSQRQFRAAVECAIRSQHYRFARPIIENHEVLTAHRPALARIPLETEATAISLAGIRFMLAFAESLTPEDCEAFEQRLVNRLTSTAASPDLVELLGEAKTAAVFSEGFDPLVWRLFDRLTESPAAPPIPLLQLVLPISRCSTRLARTPLCSSPTVGYSKAPARRSSRRARSPRFAGKQRTGLAAALLAGEAVVPPNG